MVLCAGSGIRSRAAVAVQGFVRDVDGRPIEGAAVRLDDGADSAVTDSAGQFLLGLSGPLAVPAAGHRLADGMRYTSRGLVLRGMKGTALTVRLFDLRGRTVRRVHDGPVPASMFELPFGARSGAADGTYVVRISIGTRRYARKLTRLGGRLLWRGELPLAKQVGLARRRAAHGELEARKEGYTPATVSLERDTTVGLLITLLRPGQALPEGIPQRVSVAENDAEVVDYVCVDHESSYYAWLGGSLRAYNNDCIETELRRLPYRLITLSNGLVEVDIAPELGMRVLAARDVRDSTETNFFTSWGPWMTNRWLQGNGGVEPSFPFYETGTGTIDQRAGYRIVEHPGGAVTVAMNMRMDHRQTEMDMGFIGKYGDRPLSCWVTLRPGTNLFEITYRAENPNPLRRSDRIWTNSFFPNDPHDADQEILFPTYWAMDHECKRVWAANGRITGTSPSNFALDTKMPFSGAWYGDEGVNRLRITDPDEAPGCKVFEMGYGYFEIWGSTNVLFEAPEYFVEAYEPIEITQRFYITRGIGKAAYADENVAISLTSDSTFEMVSTRYGRVSVRSGDEEVVADAPIGPSIPVTAAFADSVAVAMDGRVVYEGPLPIVLDRDSTRLPFIRQASRLSWGGGGRRAGDLQGPGAAAYFRNIELEGYQSRWQTLNCLAALFAGIDQNTGFEPSMSLANTCYRLGRFSLARIHLAIAANTPGADTARVVYLRGLIDWEGGDTVRLDAAGVRGNYHRAMLALRDRDRDRAIELLEEYLEWNPEAFRPRLMLAYLTGNVGLAARCCDENPGSPEALAVMAELGYAPARAELETLVSTATGADVALANFLDEIKHGRWRHGRRYEYTPQSWSATLRFPEELKY